MKKELIIVFLIFSTIASATDYYVSSSGDDANNNGLSSSTSWKTIAKVNSAFSIMKPGDRILFNRGETFYGTLTIAKSGSNGSPIVIGAYGTGADPIISGFSTITGWTDETGGVYSKIITCESSPLMVTFNGVNTPMGRWPNTGWLTIDSHATNVTITDAALPASPDWDGAEVVIRKYHWFMDVNTITDHTGSTITYNAALPSKYEATDGFGYFIQDDLETLDALGEWYFNPATSKFYIYFGMADPTSYEVKVAIRDILVKMEYKDYITIDNISFQGANKTAFYIGACEHLTIQNCTIKYGGSHGIKGGDMDTGVSGSDYFTLTNSVIDEVNGRGISLTGEFINGSIDNNTISNIGTIAGGGSGIDDYMGMYLWKSDGTIVEYNTIYNIGFNPIVFFGNNIKVRYNYIHDFCYVQDDGGGIATSGSGYTGRDIIGNIVINAIGAPNGTVDNFGDAMGIYLDDKSTDVNVTGNTCANNITGGIYLHNAHEDTVTNNVLFNNGSMQLLVVHHTFADHPIRNLNIENNLFFAKGRNQLCLNFMTEYDDIDEFGTAGYNYYARPIDDNLTISTQINAWDGTRTQRTLATWQSYVSQDESSYKSPIAHTDTSKIDFYYNATKVNKIITLNQPMIDVKGTKYANKITLPPFTSAILMVDPNPAQVIPVTSLSVTGAGGTTTITTDDGTLQLIAIVLPADATNNTVTWSIINGTGQATISSTGLVTAVADSTVTAKATANDGSGVSGTLVITISNQTVLVTGITVTGAGSATTITTNDGTLQLSAAVLPVTTTDKTVTWSITNGTGQATISSTGLVTAVANGTVTAKAMANDGSGVSGTLTITISKQVTPVNSITVSGENEASIITSLGSTLQLSAAVLPANATDKLVTWSITNGTGQATISTTGLVTAVDNGTVTAKATANDGSGVSGTLTITISNQMIPITAITVTGANGATTITSYGGTLRLSASILPTNATYKTITWSVVNGTGQASIDDSGLVTAITNGNVTVTAIAADGSGVSGNLLITIVNQSINNNPPVINDQQFAIQESTFTNNIIGTVIANDIDLTQNLSYTIISGNESDIFSINALTGELTTIVNNIFGPVTLTHELIVKVTDNALEPASASANITVKLIGKSTIVYINPDNTNDLLANGSIDHPYDSWDDVTWKEGCTYLQKRGTETTTNKILIGASKVTLGAYGEGESPVISSETNTYLVSGFEKSGIKIRDLDLQATNAVSCIYFLGNSGDSIVIEHCVLKANANAIKVVDGSTLVTKYNTITSNHEGIYSTAVSNEIYYNIFKSCNTAVNVVSNSSKANIYNNVFFDNEKSLSVSYAELTLYNNIFYMTTSGQMALSHGTGNIESDHNIFYPEQAGFITIANTEFDNLDELQKSLKIDMNSFNSDPLFVDIYNENFSLASGSPAINTGVDLQLGIDYEGSTVPLAGGTDIGINEFTGPIIPSKKPNEKSVMTLYPNPSSGQISIMAEIKQDLFPEDPGLNQLEIRVMDISGKTVFYKLLENQNSAIIQDDIDLAGISNGLYFVVLHIADEFIKEKLIIAK